MKLSYKVTQDDYKKIIEYTLKEQAKTLRSRIFFFLRTIGILLLAAVLILCYSFSFKRNLILLGAALLAAGANFLSSRAYKQKAENLFTQMMKRKTIQPCFWKAHKLEPREDGLFMVYGDTEYVIPWNNLIAPDLDDDFLYIKNIKKSVVEGVPRCAVSKDHLNEFMELMKTYQNTTTL